MLKTFLLIVFCVAVASAIVCTPDSCDGVDCKDPPTQSSCGKNKEPGPVGECGCCQGCITIIDDGQECPHSNIRGGPYPMSKCRDGSQCQKVGKKYKCEPSY